MSTEPGKYWNIFALLKEIQDDELPAQVIENDEIDAIRQAVLNVSDEQPKFFTTV